MKQIFFRIIGVTVVFLALFALYDFGKDIFPLFERLIAGVRDSFEMFTVLTSFFLGGPALFWVGTRLIVLRSFSPTWLYYAIFPVTVWFMELYDIGLIFDMDRALTLIVMYFLMYGVLLRIVLFIHVYWFTPLSHEKMGHVGLEHPNVPKKSLRWLLIVIIFVSLLLLHPAGIGITLKMLVSPVLHLFDTLWQYLYGMCEGSSICELFERW